MKKLVFLCFLLVMGSQSIARNAKFGIKGGMYFSTLPHEISTNINSSTLIALHESNTGYHLGLVGSFVFPGFFIQPEILFTGTGHYMQFQSEEISDAEEFFTQKFRHLSAPLLLGMKVGPLKIGAGPVFSLLLNQYNDSDRFSDIQINMKDATVGYQLGVGLQFGSILLEGRYESGLSKYGDGVSVGDQHFDFDMRPRQMILSIGLLF
jgi:hypothetical protein